MAQLFTIGHSTRSIDEFVEMLESNSVKQLVDIRTIPRSRHNPQYEQSSLEKSLPAQGIRYIYLSELGGLRPKVQNSINQGWRNDSFRNYADYMQSGEFKHAIAKLIELMDKQPTAIMCAEAVPWRCHRSLVADALLVRGHEVSHIMSKTTVNEHKQTSFAKVNGTKITYPDENITA